MIDRAERLTEIDALKAAGIVTIVLIHALRPPWNLSVSALEVWLGHVTRFGVPAFLFASGFLYARATPSPWTTVTTRLRRILVPYVIASLLAHGLGATGHASRDPMVILTDLALGSAFGPFYYVFMIVGLVIVSPVFERLPSWGLAALAITAIVLQCAVDVFTVWPLHLHWHIRNPALWWGYYLAGWWLRLYGDALRAFVGARRNTLGAVAGLFALACIAVAGGDEATQRVQVRTGAWLGSWAIIITVWIAGSRRAGSPTWLAHLSDATYTIFLYHLFFVLPLRHALPLEPGAVALVPMLVPWAVGIVAPLAILALARATLGERSRLVLGA